MVGCVVLLMHLHTHTLTHTQHTHYSGVFTGVRWIKASKELHLLLLIQHFRHPTLSLIMLVNSLRLPPSKQEVLDGSEVCALLSVCVCVCGVSLHGGLKTLKFNKQQFMAQVEESFLMSMALTPSPSPTLGTQKSHLVKIIYSRVQRLIRSLK